MHKWSKAKTWSCCKGISVGTGRLVQRGQEQSEERLGEFASLTSLPVTLHQPIGWESKGKKKKEVVLRGPSALSNTRCAVQHMLYSPTRTVLYSSTRSVLYSSTRTVQLNTCCTALHTLYSPTHAVQSNTRCTALHTLYSSTRCTAQHMLYSSTRAVQSNTRCTVNTCCTVNTSCTAQHKLGCTAKHTVQSNTLITN